MAQASKLWTTVTGLALVVACSNTGVNLGDNPGHGSGGSTNDVDASNSGGDSPSSGGSANGSGGSEHTGSGGSANPGSGGSEHTASGGTTHAGSGGSEHTASGGTTHAGSGGAPDCSTAGCGEPPICGHACGAPCGCCGCNPNDYLLVNDSAYQCAGDCYSPATYGYVDLATGAFRFAIIKKDEYRNRCFRLVMGTITFGPFHVYTSPGLFVESASWSKNAADCDSVSPTSDGTVPLDITGNVLAVRNDKGVCVMNLDAIMYLEAPSVTETLKTPPFAIPDIACQ